MEQIFGGMFTLAEPNMQEQKKWKRIYTDPNEQQLEWHTAVNKSDEGRRDHSI